MFDYGQPPRPHFHDWVTWAFWVFIVAALVFGALYRFGSQAVGRVP